MREKVPVGTDSEGNVMYNNVEIQDQHLPAGKKSIYPVIVAQTNIVRVVAIDYGAYQVEELTANAMGSQVWVPQFAFLSGDVLQSPHHRVLYLLLQDMLDKMIETNQRAQRRASPTTGEA